MIRALGKMGAGTRFGLVLAVAVVCSAFAAFGVAASGAASPPAGPPVTHGPGTDSGPDKHHDRSPALRTIPPSHTPGKSHPARPVPGGPSAHSGTHAGNTGGSTQSPAAPAAGSNFDGIGANGSAPPDDDVAAGPSQVVELVNTEFAVYSKTGATILSPRATNTLWSGFGGGCQTNNDGDGTILFDTISQRWVIQQFSVSTTPYLDCVAVSTTSDATGTWNRYSFQLSNFPDYPKMGVWPDAYYASYNMFNGNTFLGAQMCAMNRSAMLTDAAATMQCAPSLSQGSVLPATLDGTTPPPSGEPEWFVGISPSHANTLAYWKFHVDWSNPANTTLTGPTNLGVTAFSELCGGDASCVPQSGTRAALLDSLGDRLMFRLAYRNFGDHEAMVVSHSVVAGTTGGTRWYELRPSGGSLSVFQQGTSPPSSTYRWMGSIAMDHSGDMGLGYSTSSSSLHPGVAYTGRLATDAGGTMQGETQMITGAGSQTRTLTRWGDYSEMSVDPADDCTFWYMNEYLPANGTFNWKTRIGSFKFPGCGSSGGPSVTVSPSSVSTGGTVTVSWSGVSSPTTTDWIGVYVPGSSNTANGSSGQAWFYASSCSQTPGASALSSGSCSFKMPSISGTYELRMFSHDTYTLLATSNQVSVTGSPSATLTVPSTGSTGSSVTVSWSGVTDPTTSDWIGVYVPGSSNMANGLTGQAWVYDSSCTQTPGSSALSSGSCTFNLPSVSGTYELRMFSHDGYTLLATSNQVSVTGSPSATLTVPSTASPGSSVTVSWSGVTDPTYTDWIGVYVPGSSNTSNGGSGQDWLYDSSCTQTPGSTAFSSGSCSITMPSTPGTYELRMFANNGYTLLGTSNQVTVG